MKRVGLILMIASMTFEVSAIESSSRTTEQKVLARGQPEIQQTFSYSYAGFSEDIEDIMLDSESYQPENPGIVATNLEGKNEMVVSTGDRKVRDVDSCSVIPYYILNTKSPLVVSRYTLPRKFGLSIKLYC